MRFAIRVDAYGARATVIKGRKGAHQMSGGGSSSSQRSAEIERLLAGADSNMGND